jgi:hypothetical protein
MIICHNPKACKGTCQEGSWGVTFRALESAKECEGMNLHTPQWAPILGVGVSMDSEPLTSNYRGQNPLDWNVPYIIGKFLEPKRLKWACMTHLDI